MRIMFELKVHGGNIVKIFKENDEKAVIEYNGVNYDFELMIKLLEENKNNDSSVRDSEIQQFEQDPEMRKMVEDSEQDIKQGKVLSTKEVISKIRRGVI